MRPAQDRQLVTLTDCALVVDRAVRSLRRYRRPDYEGPRMPEPVLRGRGQRPDRYDWSEVKPWLELMFGAKLPDVFPNDCARG